MAGWLITAGMMKTKENVDPTRGGYYAASHGCGFYMGMDHRGSAAGHDAQTCFWHRHANKIATICELNSLTLSCPQYFSPSWAALPPHVLFFVSRENKNYL